MAAMIGGRREEEAAGFTSFLFAKARQVRGGRSRRTTIRHRREIGGAWRARTDPPRSRGRRDETRMPSSKTERNNRDIFYNKIAASRGTKPCLCGACLTLPQMQPHHAKGCAPQQGRSRLHEPPRSAPSPPFAMRLTSQAALMLTSNITPSSPRAIGISIASAVGHRFALCRASAASLSPLPISWTATVSQAVVLLKLHRSRPRVTTLSVLLSIRQLSCTKLAQECQSARI